MPSKPGKPHWPNGSGDRLPVGVVDAGGAVVDRRVDVLRAEEALEPGVAALLVRAAGRAARSALPVADAAAGGAVDRDADEVGLRERARGGAGRRDLRAAALDPLGRAGAEDLRHVAGRIGRVDGDGAAAVMGVRERRRQVTTVPPERVPTCDRRELGTRAVLEDDRLAGGEVAADAGDLMFVAPAADAAASVVLPVEPDEIAVLFSSSVFARPTSPTSQPARVYGTHGAGALRAAPVPPSAAGRC